MVQKTEKILKCVRSDAATYSTSTFKSPHLFRAPAVLLLGMMLACSPGHRGSNAQDSLEFMNPRV